MAVFELLLRISLHDPEPTAFIGPTVGGASLGMMLPLTRAKELSTHGTTAPRRISFDRGEDRLAQLTNLATWVGFTAWACSLYLSLADERDITFGLATGRTSIFIGAIIWIVVVVVDIARGGKT